MTATNSDDPWAYDCVLRDRIQLARSCLGHADAGNWQQQIGRALAALEGKSIETILEGEGTS